MKKLLSIATLAAAVLAGCGNETCSTALNVSTASGQCSALAAGVQATMSVRVCQACPSIECQAEVRSDISTIEVSPVVRSCGGDLGCDSSGCAVQALACPLSAPLEAGKTYTVKYMTASGLDGYSLTAGGGPSTCTL